MKLRYQIAVIAGLLISGCAHEPPPLEEYTFARSAIEAARAIDSAKYSPGYYAKADDAYRKGQQVFEDRDYGDARVEFLKVKEFAEKAENSARLIRFKNGEVL
jgi:hypothetical protein